MHDLHTREREERERSVTLTGGRLLWRPHSMGGGPSSEGPGALSPFLWFPIPANAD